MNAPRFPNFNGARSVREIDNFLWGLEAYFGVMSIREETQKVGLPSFLKTWPSYVGIVGVMTLREGPILLTVGIGSRGDAGEFYPKDVEYKDRAKFCTFSTKMVKLENTSCKISKNLYILFMMLD